MQERSSSLLVDNSREISQTVSFELLRRFAGRHRGHHELEVGGGGGLQHQDHEDSLTCGTRSVLLAVKPAPTVTPSVWTDSGDKVKLLEQKALQ